MKDKQTKLIKTNYINDAGMRFYKGDLECPKCKARFFSSVWKNNLTENACPNKCNYSGEFYEVQQ